MFTRSSAGLLSALSALFFVAIASAQEAGLPSHPSVLSAPVPSWAGTLDFERPLSQRAESGSPTTLLYAETQLRVPRTGDPEQLIQEVYRLENLAGADDLSTWSLVFDPTYQKLVVHHVAVLRNGDWQDRIARSRWSITHREERLESRIYDGRLSLVLIVDDLRVGDVLHVAYSTVGKSELLGDDFATSVSLTLGQLTRLRKISVLSEVELDYRLLGNAPEPDSDQRQGAWRKLTWEMSDLEPPAFEPFVPPRHSLSPWIQFSTYADWNEVARWGTELFRVPDERLPELDAVTRRLRDKQPTEKLFGARNWVQREIRYFGVAIGQHSHRPHSPSETLERRYGDCKDKTLLLLALLDRLGIEAWPVLVETDWRDGVEDFVPSPYAFDHVLVIARLDDQEWWVDPTLSHQGGARLEQLVIPGYGAGLPLLASAQDLVAPPEIQTQGNRKESFFHYRLDESLQRFEVDIQTAFHGSQAESTRLDLDFTSEEDLQEGYLDYYASDDQLDVAVRLPLVVSDDIDENRIEIAEFYEVHREESLAGWRFFTLPMELGNVLPLPDEERDAPLALPYPLSRQEVLSITTTAQNAWEPVSEEVDNEWFRFSATSVVDQTLGSLVLTYTLTTKAAEVAHADLERYRSDAESVQENLGYALGDYVEEPEILETGVPAVAVGLLLGGLVALGCMIALWRTRVGERSLASFFVRPTTPPLTEGWHGGLLFRSAKGRVLAASVGLAIIALTLPLLLLFSILEMLGIGGLFSQGPRAAIEMSFGITALFYILVYVLTIALFLRAQRALVRNLSALGLEPLEYGVGWSTWCWFVPIANLFVPPATFGQIARATAGPAERPVLGRLIGSWWALFLVGSIAGRVGSRLDTFGVAARGIGNGIYVFGLVVVLLAALAAILVLRTLSETVALATYRAAAAETRGESGAPTASELAEMLYPASQDVATETVAEQSARPQEERNANDVPDPDEATD